MTPTSPALRLATVSVLSLRIAYGLGLIVAPEKLAGGRWLGPGARRGPAQVPLRGVGAREIGVHGAALLAALRGDPLRPLLAISILGDVGDIGATALSREDLPEGSAVGTTAVAGGSLALTAALALLHNR
jgi:zinc transporter ZupT